MKKFLVIGNPIEHSLSPRLHNYWFKQNNIDATYEKKQIEEVGIKEIISDIRNGNIKGINVTVPFKKKVIGFMDELSSFAKQTESVNIVYTEKKKIIGGNTDVPGFGASLNHINYNLKGKTVLILGAGGVVPSIIVALNSMQVSKIVISNRTKEKAETLKKKFPFINLLPWGELGDFDMIINATSIGLKNNDKTPVDLNKVQSGKFFYDVIYNPKKTSFLLEAKKRKNQVENGKMMFIYQAQLSFEIWHGIKPKIDKKVLELLEND